MPRLKIKDLVAQVAYLQQSSQEKDERITDLDEAIRKDRVRNTELGAQIKLLNRDVRVSIEGIRHYQSQRDTLIGFCEAGRRDQEYPVYPNPQDTGAVITGLDKFLDSVRTDYVPGRDYSEDPMDQYR